MPHEIVLVVIAVFPASVVEAVGALTIVLAVVHTAGWRDRRCSGRVWPYSRSCSWCSRWGRCSCA